MQKTQLILVGGFLGAGKTTLLARAAITLISRGMSVGLITNDQAAELVDTDILRQAGLNVREIAGGCFCCRFDQLIETANGLRETSAPHIIIGEPVGSCTDLSATVLQPIKDIYKDDYQLAPFSVLVDPMRLWEALEPRRASTMHASARYILRKQLEEADIIVVNKVDLLDAAEISELTGATAEVFPGKPLRFISALTGAGVGEWLDDILGSTSCGNNIVDVDYDTYAEGEAILGWLNAAATVTTSDDIDWTAFGISIIEIIRRESKAVGGDIAHVKIALDGSGAQLSANLTATDGTIRATGTLPATTHQAHLTVNARVEMTPEEISRIVELALAEVAVSGVTIEIDTICSLSPGRPTPTHRYQQVV